MGRPPSKKLHNYRYTEDGKMIIAGNLKELPLECCYDRIPHLKKSGLLIEYEPWQIQEIARCSDDIEYFCEKYVYIIDADKGKILLELRDYQRRMLKAYVNNRFSVTMCPRQGGKSLIAAIFILHHMIFNSDKKSAILANKASTAKEIFNKIRMAYNDLPYWLQIGIKEWHIASMKLENGCHCFASATSSDTIRGLTVNGILFLDEFAIIRRNIAEAFFESVYPTISASTNAKIIIASTPFGLNHFYDLWKKALSKRNNFVNVRVIWDEIPGRNEKFKEDTIKNIGIKKWNQEFECVFIGSSYTLIKANILEGMESQEPISYAFDNKFKIWQFPVKGRTYVIGVDSAKGTGSDYSVIQVIDMTGYPFKQVAMYRSNEINTRAFAEIVVNIAKKYNMAWIMAENNDIGQAVIDYIWEEVEYENLVNYSPLKKREVGIRSTKKTKPIANDLLQLLIEEGKLNIVDNDTIYELSKYIEVKPGIFRADVDENDDCVTSLMWALFILKTNYLDDEIKDEKVDKIKAIVDVDTEFGMYTPAPLDGEPVDLVVK